MKRVRSTTLTKVWALSYQEQPRSLANLFRTDIHEPTRKKVHFCSKRFRVWAEAFPQCERLRKKWEFHKKIQEVKLLQFKYNRADLLSLRYSQHKILVPDHTCKEIECIISSSNSLTHKVKCRFINPRTEKVVLVDEDWYWKVVKRSPHLDGEGRGHVRVPHRLFRRSFLTLEPRSTGVRPESCKTKDTQSSNNASSSFTAVVSMEVLEEALSPSESYDSGSFQPQRTNWSRPHSPMHHPNKKFRPSSKFREPPDSRIHHSFHPNL